MNMPLRGLVGLAACAWLLTACCTPKIEGQWRAIESPVLYLAGVAMSDNALDRGYPELCREAQEEIGRQLAERLPARVGPLAVRQGEPPDADGQGRLRLAITECALDSEQSGGTFWFFLSLRVRVVFEDGGREVMRHEMEVFENARSSTPSPLYEFTFVDPVRQTLMLFDGPRVLVPRP